jgi:hypothetical protein
MKQKRELSGLVAFITTEMGDDLIVSFRFEYPVGGRVIAANRSWLTLTGLSA